MRTLSFQVWLLCVTLSVGHAHASYGNWTFTTRTHQTTARSYDQYNSPTTTEISATCTDTTPVRYSTGPHSTLIMSSLRYTNKITQYGPLSTGHPSQYYNKTQTSRTSITSYHHKPSGYPSYPSHYINETRPSSYSNITRTPGTKHHDDDDHHTIPYSISHYSIETTTTPAAVHYSTTLRNTIPGYIADHAGPSFYMSSAITGYDQPTIPTYYLAHTQH